MPIYVPGRRDKHGRPKMNGKRSVVAALALTAMVDMFTVLVVFLLQNYKTTGEIMVIDKNVELPKASETKELKPATIVIVSPKAVMIEREVVAEFSTVKEQKSWMIDNLYINMQRYFARKESEEKTKLMQTVNNVVNDIRKKKNFQPEDFRKVTLQADKNIDFLTIKKVMYTLTEAGATEISFAVIQNEEDFDEASL